MTISIEKTPTTSIAPIKKTTPIEDVTVVRWVDRETHVVHYRFPRRSKKKHVTDPDYYDIAVDEITCTTGPCQCYDYVNYRTTLTPIGQCRHQKELVQQMQEKRRLAWAEFAKEIEGGHVYD